MPSTASGIDVPAWAGRRRAAALEDVRRWYGPHGRLAGVGNEQTGHPCVLCDQPINYSFRGTDDALSVEHVKSRKHFPELTWEPSNWRPAHLQCNKAAGAGDSSGSTKAPLLGITSQ